MGYIKSICDSVKRLPMFIGDANNAVFARNLVQETLKELFRQEYTATKWASGELMPINTSVNEGAREFSYLELGQAGEAGIVADNAHDIESLLNTRIEALPDQGGNVLVDLFAG